MNIILNLILTSAVLISGGRKCLILSVVDLCVIFLDFYDVIEGRLSPVNCRDFYRKIVTMMLCFRSGIVY